MKKSYLSIAAAGAAAGAVTGLFGAGGGMVLIPLLSALTELEERSLFASSIAIILPICMVSILFTPGPLLWREALPYLLGSAIGGFAAGRWGQRIPALWLHRGLGLLILWGGWRYLWA